MIIYVRKNTDNFNTWNFIKILQYITIVVLSS